MDPVRSSSRNGVGLLRSRTLTSPDNRRRNLPWNGLYTGIRMAALDPQSSSPTLPITVTLADRSSLEFAAPFRIGRSAECEVRLQNDYVSRVHAEVTPQGSGWVIRDLGSSNGIFVDGQRVTTSPLRSGTTIRFGVGGPQLSFHLPRPASPAVPPKERPAIVGDSTMVARYADRYFRPSAQGEPVGEHTMYVRKAFAQVQTRQKKRYTGAISLLLILVLGAGGYALYLNREVRKQRASARELFYSMKSLDLEIADLERQMAVSNNPQSAEIINRYESRRKDMERGYDRFLASQHVYSAKMTEQQRITLRIARVFGECELDMPKDFEAEINRYIKYWQSSGRFARDIRLAREKGYTQTIPHELLARGLPPQFFYLALQESDFDAYNSGPITRKGIAKGMWQFIPDTAVHYGLHLGPLVDLRRPDPADERDQYEKATHAAAEYLQFLYATDAQASGLLVMACYNWGEVNILPIVRSMPANPRERNFWRLLSEHRDRIPQETYDYVFYITSAAVIGENPRLFGFDFDNPLGDLESR